MSDHELILKMIEEVDPSDTEKLDEIDMRVHCYIAKREWGGWHDEPGGVTGSWGKNKDGSRRSNSYVNHSSFDHPTRSRDVLKVIRPEGWMYKMDQDGEGWSCELGTIVGDVFEEGSSWKHIGGAGATEELAELHAIIQAIAWERAQNETA